MSFLPYIFKIIDAQLAKKEELKEARENFHRFVESLYNSPSTSAKARKDYQDIMERIKADRVK